MIRIVEGIHGDVRMKMNLVIRFDYGSVVPWVQRGDGGLKAGAGPDAVILRTEIETRVLVTERMRPLRIRGRTIHQIGVPYHWGSKGLVKGDSANELISFVADPNVSIQESKALTGDIRAGRRNRLPHHG